MMILGINVEELLEFLEAQTVRFLADLVEISQEIGSRILEAWRAIGRRLSHAEALKLAKPFMPSAAVQVF